jgi:energy-coupling factor transporter ATP-binding protein EcfA2
VDEALKEVGMLDRALTSPSMLSGGQKQRIAIAGVLAMRPKIIVFDESTAMLDPVGRKDVFKLAKRINREEGITVIWITHFYICIMNNFKSSINRFHNYLKSIMSRKPFLTF